MSTPLITRLRAQCGGPRDGALLRFTLAQALFADGQLTPATSTCRQALDFDASYSAAWKLLGQILLAADDPGGAANAWREGIRVAGARGDKQAEKEMGVFLRRLSKKPSP